FDRAAREHHGLGLVEGEGGGAAVKHGAPAEPNADDGQDCEHPQHDDEHETALALSSRVRHRLFPVRPKAMRSYSAVGLRKATKVVKSMVSPFRSGSRIFKVSRTPCGRPHFSRCSCSTIISSGSGGS